MRTTIAVISILLFSTIAAAPAAGGADYAGPLRVSVTSPDSKPKIKVARKLKVLLSCSKDCRAKVRITLKTPINRLKVGGTQQLAASYVWTAGIRLTNFGLRYLKKNYRKSVLKVVATATDTANGKHASKTRYFRFYR